MTTIKKQTFRQNLQYQSSYDSPEMHEFFADPDQVMAKHTVKMFKNKPNDTSTVALVHYAGRDWVLKRYNIKGLAHGIKRALLKTKARVSWDNALLLNELGIPTIKPVAMIEQRFGCFKGVAYLIAEYHEGVLAVDYFAPDSPHQDKFEKTIHSLGELIKRMEIARIVHDDFQIHNILIVDEAPVLLDLDHMRRFRKRSNQFIKEHQKDIAHIDKFLEFSPVVHRLFRELGLNAAQNL